MTDISRDPLVNRPAVSQAPAAPVVKATPPAEGATPMPTDGLAADTHQRLAALRASRGEGPRKCFADAAPGDDNAAVGRQAPRWARSTGNPWDRADADGAPRGPRPDGMGQGRWTRGGDLHRQNPLQGAAPRVGQPDGGESAEAQLMGRDFNPALFDGPGEGDFGPMRGHGRDFGPEDMGPNDEPPMRGRGWDPEGEFGPMRGHGRDFGPEDMGPNDEPPMRGRGWNPEDMDPTFERGRGMERGGESRRWMPPMEGDFGPMRGRRGQADGMEDGERPGRTWRRPDFEANGPMAFRPHHFDGPPPMGRRPDPMMLQGPDNKRVVEQQATPVAGLPSAPAPVVKPAVPVTDAPALNALSATPPVAITPAPEPVTPATNALAANAAAPAANNTATPIAHPAGLDAVMAILNKGLTPTDAGS